MDTLRAALAYYWEAKIGVRGRAPGTGYFIPARAGVWRVLCGSWGPLGGSGLSLLRLAGLALGRCFSRYVLGGGAYREMFS